MELLLLLLSSVLFSEEALEICLILSLFFFLMSVIKGATLTIHYCSSS